eukprot:gene10567-biopygen15640
MLYLHVFTDLLGSVSVAEVFIYRFIRILISSDALAKTVAASALPSNWIILLLKHSPTCTAVQCHVHRFHHNSVQFVMLQQL